MKHRRDTDPIQPDLGPGTKTVLTAENAESCSHSLVCPLVSFVLAVIRANSWHSWFVLLTAENAERFDQSLISFSATSASSAVKLLCLPLSCHPPSSILDFPPTSITRPIFNFDKTESAYLFQITNTGKNRTHLPRKAAYRARKVHSFDQNSAPTDRIFSVPCPPDAPIRRSPRARPILS